MSRVTGSNWKIAILNLVVNARDAMPDGGVLAISASYPSAPEGHFAKDHGFVRLVVADQGEGMDEATRTMALEPFFTTKGDGSGTGLGLSMVHGVVQELGGVIGIASEPGAGTQVSLWLPITHDVEAQRPAPRIANAVMEVEGVAVVVDDHNLVRRGTAAMLREEGYKVVEVASAEACLVRLEEGLRPALLITDHVMPGMTGLDLVHRVADLYPQVPILLVSGYDGLDATPADIVRMTKPFRQHELQAAIARARRQAQMRSGSAPSGVSRTG